MLKSFLCIHDKCIEINRNLIALESDPPVQPFHLFAVNAVIFAGSKTKLLNNVARWLNLYALRAHSVYEPDRTMDRNAVFSRCIV
jgi:hypothetical protein